MGRVWILTGALMAVSVILFIFSGFMGKEGMLTIGLCIGAGAAAAYIQGEPGIGRAMYLFGGVFIGALGFGLGAMTFPDTNVGLFLGAFVPQIITGFAADRPGNHDLPAGPRLPRRGAGADIHRR